MSKIQIAHILSWGILHRRNLLLICLSRKPENPGFVETPGRRKSQRKSLFLSSDSTYDSTPEPEESARLNGFSATYLNGDAKNDTYANGNGQVNGHTNGHANGHMNGYTNGSADGLANGKTKNEVDDFRAEAEKNFSPKDTSGKSEFGGALGMSAMMIGFPLLMYYMWIGAIFYDGKFPKPAEGQSSQQFFEHMWFLVKTEAFPNNRAWRIYWFFGLVQMAFYMLMPGVYRKGKSLPHLGGKQLDYYCSAMFSFYSSIVIMLALHFTGVFKLYSLIDEFGHIMSVAIISGFLCSIIAYVSARIRGATVRMTGSFIVDFFSWR